MRRGPSTQNAIVRMLESGTPLEVISSDAQTGYSRVRLTTSNTEGYVLTRYLMVSQPLAVSLRAWRNGSPHCVTRVVIAGAHSTT